MEIRFSRRTAIPSEILRAVTPAFDKLFSPMLAYRQTGVHRVAVTMRAPVVESLSTRF